MAAPRRERGSADGPVSVERIEEAAVRLFGEKSYSVVGMRDISEAVGILPGSLYVHIRKKEDLLLRIVERGIRNYLDVIQTAATSGLPAPDRLRGAIVAYMRVLAGSLPQTRVAFHQWTYLSPPGQERVIELRRALGSRAGPPTCFQSRLLRRPFDTPCFSGLSGAPNTIRIRSV